MIHKKNIFLNSATIFFSILFFWCMKIHVSNSLEFVSLKFDNVQEIQDLEEFLLSPEIIENLPCLEKQRVQRRINKFKTLEEGTQQQLFLQNAYYVAVAKKNEKIYGVAMSFLFEGKLYLEHLFVKDECKDQGIELQLLQQICKQSGVNIIEKYIDFKSLNEQIYTSFQQLQFVSEKQFSCMVKSTDDFSAFHNILKQSDQLITILPINKEHDIEIGCFELFNDKDTTELLNNADAEWAKKKLKSEMSHAFCAQDKDGNYVGAILYEKQSDDFIIQLLAISKQYQRQGIAKRLLLAVQ